MSDRPVTLIAPAIGALIAGTLKRLRRPSDGPLHPIAPGDRLWIREQFYLPRYYDHVSPTRAAELGATPVFAHDRDLPEWASGGLGPRRFARSLPKIWHRHHLVVTAVVTERLQAITDAEIEAEGHASREQFAAAWDAGLTLSGGLNRRWAADPHVLVIDFRHVAGPLPLEQRSYA